MSGRPKAEYEDLGFVFFRTYAGRPARSPANRLDLSAGMSVSYRDELCPSPAIALRNIVLVPLRNLVLVPTLRPAVTVRRAPTSKGSCPRVARCGGGKRRRLALATHVAPEPGGRVARPPLGGHPWEVPRGGC